VRASRLNAKCQERERISRKGAPSLGFQPWIDEVEGRGPIEE
jgi:hypothetical protein